MRTDRPPFTDVRVRRAISQAVDRQGLIEAVWMRGEPSPAVPRGLARWSLPIDQLGAGAKYYQYDPKEARRLLAEAGHPKGLKTQLTVSSGYARDLVDATRLAMMAGAGGTGFVPGPEGDDSEDNTGYGDIVVCRISTGACRLAVPGPRPGENVQELPSDQIRILPGFGTPGTN